MQRYRPNIVVDCINSATAIAYQDVFQVSRDVVSAMGEARTRGGKKRQDLFAITERLLCTLYIPQLIRHVQLIYRSMQEAKPSLMSR